MTKPTTTIDHQEPSLPSPHIDHASVFVNELDARLFVFDSGIMALETELSGMEIVFDQENTERDKKHADATAESAKKYDDAVGARKRQLVDMNRGRRMAMAGKEAYAAEIPSGDE